MLNTTGGENAGLHDLIIRSSLHWDIRINNLLVSEQQVRKKRVSTVSRSLETYFFVV